MGIVPREHPSLRGAMAKATDYPAGSADFSEVARLPAWLPEELEER
ncbi:MAG: hypothetical protein QF903_14800 [Planctomycetota bacterium]|nr:hypothetical protein [Planctomycetota bacterium]